MRTSRQKFYYHEWEAYYGLSFMRLASQKGLETQIDRFSYEMDFFLKESLLPIVCAKTFSGKVVHVRHSLA